MKTRITMIAMTTAALFLTPLAVAQNGTPPETPPGPSTLQGLANEFRDMRQEMIAEREQLMVRVRQAETDAERKALMQQFREQHQEQFANARELRKELRRRVIEIRRERRSIGQGPGGSDNSNGDASGGDNGGGNGNGG